MLAVRNLLRTTAPIARNVQQRSMSGVAVPSREKVSRGELIFLSGSLVFGWLAIPTWVLLNLKNYREKN